MRARSTVFASLALVSALALSACGVTNSSSESGSAGKSGANAVDSKWSHCDLRDGAKDVSAQSGTAGDKKTDITIGAFNGWDESFATAYLLKAVLDKQGYKVKVEAFEAAPGYVGAAKGDIDVLTDSWLPTTHADYIKQYGDKLDSLGCWYDNAKLTIAVNDNSPAKSIADLSTMGSDYDNALIGIEPGAGLTKQTKDKAIPEYGLTNLTYTTASTPAMLAAIKKSQQDGKNIAVTLWRPHWAYSAFPMRDLEDPKGAMGGKENIYSFGHKGWAADNPHAAQIIKNLVLSDDNLASLENEMFGADKGNGKDNEGSVANWLQEHPDFETQLTAGKL